MGTLYESIKELCIENGIKPSKMCVDLEMSKSMMTKLKNGTKKNIETGTAQKIADYFGVSVDRVLGSEQKEKSPAPEGAELTKERIQMMLEQMSAAELVELMSDITDTLKRRGTES